MMRTIHLNEKHNRITKTMNEIRDYKLSFKYLFWLFTAFCLIGYLFEILVAIAEFGSFQSRSGLRLWTILSDLWHRSCSYSYPLQICKAKAATSLSLFSTALPVHFLNFHLESFRKISSAAIPGTIQPMPPASAQGGQTSSSPLSGACQQC